MCRDSLGAAVNVLLKYLDPDATEEVAGRNGIILDGRLGDVGMKALQEWRANRGLPYEGWLDPAAIRTMRTEHFDIIGAWEDLPSAAQPTMFVQPDGSELWWAPGIAATPHADQASSRWYRSHRGN